MENYVDASPVHGFLFTLHSYARHVIDCDVNPRVLC